jgi:hypothetical protein
VVTIDLKSLVGKWVLVQFRTGVQMVLAGRPPGEAIVDFIPRGPGKPVMPASVDTYSFLVAERDSRFVLLYSNPMSPGEMMTLEHLPLELVAFVTSSDNPVNAPSTPQ